MKLLDNIIRFLKNIFSKKEDVKMLEAGNIDNSGSRRDTFLENLKINIVKKRKVETYVWNGNGLGIQSKLKY